MIDVFSEMNKCQFPNSHVKIWYYSAKGGFALYTANIYNQFTVIGIGMIQYLLSY